MNDTEGVPQNKPPRRLRHGIAPAEPPSDGPLREEDLRGYKFFHKIRVLLERLRPCAEHPNRLLHYDEYATLVLFYFFNPAITSLRGIHEVSDMATVRKRLGVRRMSLGSLSESVRLFDPELLGEVFGELAARAPQRLDDPKLEELREVLTVADGTILRALPRMTWAVWLRDEHRGAKAHVQFEVLKDTAVRVEVTPGNTPENERLRANLGPGRLYVLDRGYNDFELWQAIADADSSFVVRLHENAVYEVIQENVLTADGRDAGVQWDGIVRLGYSEKMREKLTVPVRLVKVHVAAQAPRGLGYRRKEVSSKKTFRQEPGVEQDILVATSRVDLPADVIALIYWHRWKVELFFRMLKCLMGCRHLISESLEGVTIQLYCALIAALLLAEQTGMRPNKRALEVLTLYLQGWCDEEDAVRLLAKHAAKKEGKAG